MNMQYIDTPKAAGAIHETRSIRRGHQRDAVIRGTGPYDLRGINKKKFPELKGEENKMICKARVPHIPT